jgi:hypothetical protein
MSQNWIDAPATSVLYWHPEEIVGCAFGRISLTKVVRKESKKIMKKFYAIIGMAGALMVPSLYANITDNGQFITITATSGGQYEYGNGGEFTAVVNSGPLAPAGSTFQTFCLEVNENISWGDNRDNYIINAGAVRGGGGANTIDPHTGMTMDNISIGTAWLYSQFRAGTLTLDNGGGSYFDGNRQANAGELQQAIWFLEGESEGVDNGYVTLAETKTGNTGSLAGVEADSHGEFGVVVLNLYNGPAYQTVSAPNGTQYEVNQDMLAIVPEPSTVISGVLMLLPFGASTLRIMRRKAA